jgi:hypothetical protein
MWGKLWPRSKHNPTEHTMSDANPFGKFVPGFDFLQNLAKGAAGNIPQMPNPANWVAPTLNLEELDKRIGELKAVQFWLDQNAKALAATITALEVQKMTLATLKGMNFNMGDVANAFKLKAADTMASAVTSAKDKVTETVTGKKPPVRKKSKTASPSATGIIDPMQLWSSLTQQFGQIASSAMKDAAKQNAIDTTRNMAKAMTKTAFNTAKSTAGQMAKTAGSAASQTMQRMGAAPATKKSTATKKMASRAKK